MRNLLMWKTGYVAIPSRLGFVDNLVFHLTASCFSFPASQADAHAKLTPLLRMDLGALTLDFQATNTQKTASPYLISYATEPGNTTGFTNSEIALNSDGALWFSDKSAIGSNIAIPELHR
jgi:hypothetical protein